MADHTTIEWVVALAQSRGAIPATWNPIEGCSRASDGCRGCYAASMQRRFRPELVDVAPDGYVRFNGTVNFLPGRLAIPLKAKKPRVYFVGDMADLFHPAVQDDWLDQVFALMALCPQHTFLLLTKRPERMREYLSSLISEFDQMVGWTVRFRDAARKAGALLGDIADLRATTWPLPNVWLGTTTENQATADERIPHLLATPSAKRFISAEPLLGSLDLRMIMVPTTAGGSAPFDCLNGSLAHEDGFTPSSRRLDWVIAGGESGPGARPAHPDWFRALRDQCQSAEVPFLFKQNGAWLEVEAARDILGDDDPRISDQQRRSSRKTALSVVGDAVFVQLGKKAAGRLLDGRVWGEVPA